MKNNKYQYQESERASAEQAMKQLSKSLFSNSNSEIARISWEAINYYRHAIGEEIKKSSITQRRNHDIIPFHLEKARLDLKYQQYPITIMLLLLDLQDKLKKYDHQTRVSIKLLISKMKMQKFQQTQDQIFKGQEISGNEALNHKIKLINEKIIDYTSKFYELLSSRNPNYLQLCSFALRIKKKKDKLTKIFKQVKTIELTEGKHNVPILKQFSQLYLKQSIFYSFLATEPIKADQFLQFHKKIDKAHRIQSKVDIANFGELYDFQGNDSVTLQISLNPKTLGIITQCSKNVLDVLNRDKGDLIGVHMNCLIPEFLKEQHNQQVEQFLKLGNLAKVEKARDVFLQIGEGVEQFRIMTKLTMLNQQAVNKEDEEEQKQLKSVIKQFSQIQALVYLRRIQSWKRFAIVNQEGQIEQCNKILKDDFKHLGQTDPKAFNFGKMDSIMKQQQSAQFFPNFESSTNYSDSQTMINSSAKSKYSRLLTTKPSVQIQTTQIALGVGGGNDTQSILTPKLNFDFLSPYPKKEKIYQYNLELETSDIKFSTVRIQKRVLQTKSLDFSYHIIEIDKVKSRERSNFQYTQDSSYKFQETKDSQETDVPNPNQKSVAILDDEDFRESENICEVTERSKFRVQGSVDLLAKSFSFLIYLKFKLLFGNVRTNSTEEKRRILGSKQIVFSSFKQATSKYYFRNTEIFFFFLYLSLLITSILAIVYSSKVVDFAVPELDMVHNKTSVNSRTLSQLAYASSLFSSLYASKLNIWNPTSADIEKKLNQTIGAVSNMQWMRNRLYEMVGQTDISKYSELHFKKQIKFYDFNESTHQSTTLKQTKLESQFEALEEILAKILKFQGIFKPSHISISQAEDLLQLKKSYYFILKNALNDYQIVTQDITSAIMMAQEDTSRNLATLQLIFMIILYSCIIFYYIYANWYWIDSKRYSKKFLSLLFTIPDLNIQTYLQILQKLKEMGRCDDLDGQNMIFRLKEDQNLISSGVDPTPQQQQSLRSSQRDNKSQGKDGSARIFGNNSIRDSQNKENAINKGLRGLFNFYRFVYVVVLIPVVAAVITWATYINSIMSQLAWRTVFREKQSRKAFYTLILVDMLQFQIREVVLEDANPQITVENLVIRESIEKKIIELEGLRELIGIFGEENGEVHPDFYPLIYEFTCSQITAKARKERDLIKIQQHCNTAYGNSKISLYNILPKIATEVSQFYRNYKLLEQQGQVTSSVRQTQFKYIEDVIDPIMNQGSVQLFHLGVMSCGLYWRDVINIQNRGSKYAAIGIAGSVLLGLICLYFVMYKSVIVISLYRRQILQALPIHLALNSKQLQTYLQRRLGIKDKSFLSLSLNKYGL